MPISSHVRRGSGNRAGKRRRGNYGRNDVNGSAFQSRVMIDTHESRASFSKLRQSCSIQFVPVAEVRILCVRGGRGRTQSLRPCEAPVTALFRFRWDGGFDARPSFQEVQALGALLDIPVWAPGPSPEVTGGHRPRKSTHPWPIEPKRRGRPAALQIFMCSFGDGLDASNEHPPRCWCRRLTEPRRVGVRGEKDPST